MAVCFIVYFLRWICLRRYVVSGLLVDVRIHQTAAGRCGVPGCLWHPRGRGISGRWAGRRVGPPQLVFVVEKVLRVESGSPLRIGTQDGEVLQPVQTSETVVEMNRAADVLLILRMKHHPFLFEFVRYLGTH